MEPKETKPSNQNLKRRYSSPLLSLDKTEIALCTMIRSAQHGLIKGALNGEDYGSRSDDPNGGIR